MANTANASSNLSAFCTSDGRTLFYLGCLGPSLAIIFILAFLKRRETYKLSSCNGYPGLVIPINFLRSSKSNRFAIAATFGATASTCLTLFLRPNHFELFSEDCSPWLKVIQKLATVFMYGVVFYPYFVCLTTKHKLIGSLMGFLYAAIRFAFELVFIFHCGNNYDEDTRKLNYLKILSRLPMLFCLLFILLRFAVLLGNQVRKQWFSDSSCDTWLQRAIVSETDADILLSGSTEIERVSRLLNLERNKAASDVKGLRKLLYLIYQPRPDFRFSTQFLSTLIVAGIAIFEIAVLLLIGFDHLKKSCGSNENPFCRTWNILLGSLQAASVSSSFISAILLLHFMKCHRDHVFQLYRGERKLYQDVFVSYRALVGKSLRFSGYQIAHSILGFFLWLVPILFTAFIAGFLSAFSNSPLVQKMLKWLGKVALGFLPTVVLSFLLWLFQLFLAFFVFCDREFPNITITVDNRQLFSIASYFFFFYNIILGLLAGLFRILKGLLLGVLFMARIDRPVLMQGYQTWDKAFVAYLGFLNVLVAHSHPVMLVFCHLLINRNSDRELKETLPQTESSGTSREENYRQGIVRRRRLARFSQKAANRWLLAVMLLRNPSLLRYRRQGGALTRFVDMRSASINSVVEFTIS